MDNTKNSKSYLQEILQSWNEESDAKFIGRLSKPGGDLCISDIESCKHPGKGFILLDQDWGLHVRKGNIPVNNNQLNSYNDKIGRWVIFSLWFRKNKENKFRLLSTINRTLTDEEKDDFFFRKNTLQQLTNKIDELKQTKNNIENQLASEESRLLEIQEQKNLLNQKSEILKEKNINLQEKK